MKIALLIVGRLDTFENMYPKLNEHVLSKLNPDIFFSGYSNKKGISYCEKKIKELWKPKKYFLREYTPEVRKEIHPNDEIFDSNKRSETTPHTWLSGIFNVKNANKLKTIYENENNFKYDVVIKTRTDLKWYSDISENDLLLAKSGNILIPTAWDFKCVHQDAISDMIAITDSVGMDKYSALIDHVDEYFSDGNLFHPETYVGLHIKKMKLNRIEISHGIDCTGWCLIDDDINRKNY
jgi:hypothetical protein